MVCGLVLLLMFTNVLQTQSEIWDTLRFKGKRKRKLVLDYICVKNKLTFSFGVEP